MFGALFSLSFLKVLESTSWFRLVDDSGVNGGPAQPARQGCKSSGHVFRYFLDICWTCFGHFLDCWFISGFLGHPEIGTAITKCFEHLEDEQHILNPA